MKNTLFASVLVFVLGMLVQNSTGALQFLNPELEVYAPPKSYSITRQGNILLHQAEGQRLVECEFVGPPTAEFTDESGGFVSRQLLKKARVGFDPRHVPKDVIFGDIILDKDIPQVSQHPRTFKSSSYIIVADNRTLKESVQFIIRTECRNLDQGRFLGKFGPFPIPSDGKVLTEKDTVIIEHRTVFNPIFIMMGLLSLILVMFAVGLIRKTRKDRALS